MPYQFEDKLDYSFNLDTPATIPPVGNPEREVAAYAALLSSGDPLPAFKSIMSEMENTGKSNYLESVIGVVQADENKVRQQAMADIIQDPELPKESKLAAINYYNENRQVLPDLKDKYEKTVASSYDKGPTDAQIFAKAFIERNRATKAIQQELNSVGASFSGSTWDAIKGFAVEITPFLQAAYKGPQLAAIQAAIDGEDYGVASSLWKGIFQGTAEKEIRDSLAAIPNGPQRDAAKKRILDVIRNFPSVSDYNKYTALQSSLEGDQESWERWLVDAFGLIGGAYGVRAIKGAIGKTGTGVKMAVDTESVLGKTAANNPTAASAMIGKAVVDETGEIARALGTNREKIISDLLPEVSDQTGHALKAEAADHVRKLLEPLDEDAKHVLQLSEKNALLYTDEVKSSLHQTILDTIQETKSAVLHLGKSSVQKVDDLGEISSFGSRGSAIYGKAADGAFLSYDEALETANKLAGELPEGAVEIVRLDNTTGKLVSAVDRTEGEYYLKYSWDKELQATDVLLFGKDAFKIKFDLFGKEMSTISEGLTRMAKYGKLGSYMFAHHLMPAKASAAALHSFDKAMRVEEPFIQFAREHIARQKSDVRKVVNQILKEGEDLDISGTKGGVFSYEEVIQKALASGLPMSKAKQVAEGYYVYRRLADWMYTILDRSKSAELNRDGFLWYHTSTDTRFAAKAVSRSEVEDVRAIYNKETDSVEALTKKQLDEIYARGDSLARMANKHHLGDEIVEYTVVKKGVKTSEIHSGAVPYIKGYVPRGYEDYYFVTRTPLKATINGREVVDPLSLQKYATTHKATNSMKDAQDYIKELQKKDPTGKYDVKRDRLNEKSVLLEHDSMRQSFIHSARRGKEKLDGGTLLDPLEGLTNLIGSLTKRAAMEDFLVAAKTDFVRQFGEFLAEKGKFPTSIDGIVQRPQMSVSTSDRFKDARAAYNWLEGMMILQRYDAGVWKEVMYGAGEFAEKMSPFLAKVLQSVGKNYPVDYLRKLATTLFISLRPQRQLLLQPSQLFVYAVADPTLMKPSVASKFFREISALNLVTFYKNNSAVGKMFDDDVLIRLGAKAMGISDKEFKKLADELKDTGLIQSIDSSTLIDGFYGSHSKKLADTLGDKVTDNVLTNTVKGATRAARAVGFDAGERQNILGSFLIARRRFEKTNPGVDSHSPSSVAQIASDAREMAFSMSRPGTFQYQRNALSLPLQFIAAPHKALLAMTTSKMWTPAEKARLMAAHFILYGSAGLGIQKFVMDEGVGPIPGLNLRGNYGSALGKETLQAIEGGVADWGVNKLAYILTHEESDLDISGAFSPVTGGVLPIADFLRTLNEDEFAKVILGPSWSIVDPDKGKLIATIRDIAQIMRGDYSPELKAGDIAMSVSLLASGATDWMKMRAIQNYNLLLASNGYPVGESHSVAEAYGKLFGIGTKREKVFYEEMKRSRDEKKEANDAADFLFGAFVKAVNVYSDNPDKVREFNKQYAAWAKAEPDERLKRVMAERFKQNLRKFESDTGRHLELEMYNSALSKSQEQLKNAVNRLDSYGLTEQANTMRLLLGEE